MKHLGIYSEIHPTTAMTEIVEKTLGELLSILAIATKLIKQGQPGESLSDTLPDSMKRREIRREAFWEEGRRGCTRKAGSTHPG